MVRIVLIVVGALLVAGCATYASTSGRVVVTDGNSRVAVVITDGDRRLISDYYRSGNAKGMPPGLAKRGDHLPPGLAKREQLPPGLAKRDRLPPHIHGEPLPPELEGRLSPLPSAYVRIRVGRDIVLMDHHTRVMVDIAYGLVL